MVKRNRPYNPRRSIILKVGLSDGTGIFFKGKGPVERVAPQLFDYIKTGLQLDIPGDHNVRRKKGKR